MDTKQKKEQLVDQYLVVEYLAGLLQAESKQRRELIKSVNAEELERHGEQSSQWMVRLASILTAVELPSDEQMAWIHDVFGDAYGLWSGDDINEYSFVKNTDGKMVFASERAMNSLLLHQGQIVCDETLAELANIQKPVASVEIMTSVDSTEGEDMVRL